MARSRSRSPRGRGKAAKNVQQTSLHICIEPCMVMLSVISIAFLPIIFNFLVFTERRRSRSRSRERKKGGGQSKYNSKLKKIIVLK